MSRLNCQAQHDLHSIDLAVKPPQPLPFVMTLMAKITQYVKLSINNQIEEMVRWRMTI